MNEQLVADLREDEGEQLTAYADSLGYLTIGVGILIDRRKRGSGITPAESAYLLNNRINSKRAELLARLPWVAQLSPQRQDGLVNMAFQLGVEGLMGFPHALGHIKDGRWADAERELKDSAWFKTQTPDRADRVIKQICSGEYR